MGSLKGREFIKCKPDIDAELHLFLQNYKKKGNFISWRSVLFVEKTGGP
jgi:hypothetical protein